MLENNISGPSTRKVLVTEWRCLACGQMSYSDPVVGAFLCPVCGDAMTMVGEMTWELRGAGWSQEVLARLHLLPLGRYENQRQRKRHDST